MSDLLCQCGSAAGSPHRAACPMPYFGKHQPLIDSWHRAHARKREKLHNGRRHSPQEART